MWGYNRQTCKPNSFLFFKKVCTIYIDAVNALSIGPCLTKIGMDWQVVPVCLCSKIWGVLISWLAAVLRRRLSNFRAILSCQYSTAGYMYWASQFLDFVRFGSTALWIKAYWLVWIRQFKQVLSNDEMGQQVGSANLVSLVAPVFRPCSEIILIIRARCHLSRWKCSEQIVTPVVHSLAIDTNKTILSCQCLGRSMCVHVLLGFRNARGSPNKTQNEAQGNPVSPQAFVRLFHGPKLGRFWLSWVADRRGRETRIF